MRLYSIFLTIIVSSLNFYNLQAATLPQLTRCLGQEELNIHKQKRLGAIYKLNRQLLAHIIELPEVIKIDNEKLTQICKQKDMASLRFLASCLLEDPFLLKIAADIKDTLNYNAQKQLINNFKKDSYHIFIQLLHSLQENYQRPGELAKNYKFVNPLFEKLQYLDGEHLIHEVNQHRQEIKIFFKNLENFIRS